MNNFTLTPFLAELEADNIRLSADDYERIALILSLPAQWSRERLRGALLSLLIHNSEQVGIFKQMFDQFFPDDSSVSTLFTKEQIQEIYGALQNTDWQSFGTPPDDNLPEQITPKPRTVENKNNPDFQPHNKTKKRFAIPSSLPRDATVLFLLIVGLFLFLLINRPQTDESANNQPTPQTPGPAVQTNSNPVSNNAANGNSNIVAAQPGSQNSQTNSNTMIIILVPFLVLSVSLALGLLLRIRVSLQVKGTAPKYDSQKPQFFPLNQIGGSPSPYLDGETLNDLSKSLNYFLSDNFSKRLDVEDSVKDSVQSGGMFKPHFHKLKLVRPIYIMEDAYAEPLLWNLSAREISDGLRRRGIDIRYGRFYGSLNDFQMEDGSSDWFEEIEGNKDKSLIFFFSDGKSLNQSSDGFLLESLAQCSTVACFDLREKDFWDESAEIIERYKIPLYQANKDGIIRAVKRFYTEYGAKQDDGRNVTSWHGIKSTAGVSLDKYILDLTGEDAIAWAQACSMIQPLSPGMADAIRRRFTPNLRPEQIERLFRIPGTTWNASGLYFSLPALAVLRRGFAENWITHKQEEILNFILEQIEAIKPPEEESLRYLTWQWVFERVRLEIEPDAALEVLTKLALTPLQKRIKADLSHVVLPGRLKSSEDDVQIMLRVRPKTARGMVQFHALTERLINIKELNPLEILFTIAQPGGLQSIKAELNPQFTGNRQIQNVRQNEISA